MRGWMNGGGKGKAVDVGWMGGNEVILAVHGAAEQLVQHIGVLWRYLL